MENPRFRQLFYESVSEHFFQGGALIPEKNYRRYVDWRNTIDTAIICESARWNSEDSPKADTWETSYHTFIDAYFPERTEIVFGQLIQEEMYPEVALPEFNTNYRYIEEDFELMLNSPDGGEIRYTLDGSDPGGATLARAPVNKGTYTYPYSEAVLINCSLKNILPEGWGPVGGETQNMHYWEHNSTRIDKGEAVDVSQRPDFSRQLTMDRDKELIESYSDPAFVLDGWSPDFSD